MPKLSQIKVDGSSRDVLLGRADEPKWRTEELSAGGGAGMLGGGVCDDNDMTYDLTNFLSLSLTVGHKCPPPPHCRRVGRHNCSHDSSRCGRCLTSWVENEKGRCVKRLRPHGGKLQQTFVADILIVLHFHPLPLSNPLSCLCRQFSCHPSIPSSFNRSVPPSFQLSIPPSFHPSISLSFSPSPITR